MKISEAFDLYKNNYLLIKGVSRRVLQDNGYVATRMIKVLGDKDIADLTMDDVSRWAVSITERELPDGTTVSRSQNTMRNDLTRFKMVLKYLRLRGYDCLEPALIPIPKREDVVRPFLTPEEVTSMIDNAHSLRNKFVISLLYSSGIRLSEFISLDRDSISRQRFTVVGKGKKARLCFIDDRTDKLMRQYLASRDDDSPALVVSRLHKDRMTPTNVQLLIKNSAKRAGITKNVSPHILRHSFATNFIQNNGNIRHLSVLMGHASINTTSIYTHIVDNDLENQYRLFHSVDTKKALNNRAYYAYYSVDNRGGVMYN